MWMKIPGARIHWAKEWPEIKGFNDFMRKVNVCTSYPKKNIFVLKIGLSLLLPTEAWSGTPYKGCETMKAAI